MDDVFPDKTMKVKFFGCGELVNKTFNRLNPEKYKNIEIINIFTQKNAANLPDKFDSIDFSGSAVNRIYLPIDKIVSLSDLSSQIKEIKESIESTDAAVLLFDLDDNVSLELLNLLIKLCKCKNILTVGAALVPDYRITSKKQASVLSKIDKFKEKFNLLINIEMEKLKNDLVKDHYTVEDNFVEKSTLYYIGGVCDLFDTLVYNNTKEEAARILKGNRSASISIVETSGKNKLEDAVNLLLRDKYYGINKLKTQKLLSTIIIDSSTTLDDVKEALEILAQEVQNMDIIFTVIQEEGKEDFVKFVSLAIN